MFHWTFTTIT